MAIVIAITFMAVVIVIAITFMAIAVFTTILVIWDEVVPSTSFPLHHSSNPRHTQGEAPEMRKRRGGRGGEEGSRRRRRRIRRKEERKGDYM